LNQSLPLHHRIRQALSQQIKDGKLSPGAQLPTELELTARYQVSRTTVRQALESLVRDGLIFRKRGKGTFVAKPYLPTPLTRLTSFYEDMLALGLKPSTKLLSLRRVKAAPEVAERLSVEPGTIVTAIECLRLANDEPILYTLTYLPDEIGSKLDPKQIETAALYTILEDFLDVPLFEGEYVIGAAKAGKIVSKALAIPTGNPVLLVERTTFTRDLKPVAFDLRYQRADCIRYALRLRRSPDALLGDEQPRAGRFEVSGVSRRYQIQ
jgi:GntR family transcriptional regulator